MKFSQRLEGLDENISEKYLSIAGSNKNAISLAGGTPPYDLPKVVKKMISALLLSNDCSVSKYGSSSSGSDILKKEIAQNLSEELNKKVNLDELLITSGSTAGLFSSIQLFLDQGDEMILLSPHWSLYSDQCILSGGKPVDVPLDERNGWDINISAIEKRVTKKTKLILFSDPNNPTGTIASNKSKNELIKYAYLNNLYIIADETYRHLTRSNANFKSIATNKGSSDNLILLRSFSKDFSMSGYRLGYIYANKKIISSLSRICVAMNLMPSTISQEIGIMMMHLGKNITNKYSDKYNKLVSKACNELNKMSPRYLEYVYPTGGFFIFPRYKYNMNSIDMFKHLLSHGVAVRPGSSFGNAGENHFRISLTCSLQDLNVALKRINKAFISLNNNE